jgi:hypothetical protein
VNASALKSKRRDNQALRRQESGANKKNRIYLTDSGKILKYCKFFIKTTVKLAVQNMKNRL